MIFEIQIYEKGHEYTSSLTLSVCAEDRLDLERILLENGYTVKITAVEEEDDF